MSPRERRELLGKLSPQGGSPDAGRQESPHTLEQGTLVPVLCQPQRGSGHGPAEPKPESPCGYDNGYGSVPERTQDQRMLFRLSVAVGDSGPWNNLGKRSSVEAEIKFPTSLEVGGSQ